MTTPERVAGLDKKAQRLGAMVYIFLGTAIVLFLVWMMWPPPIFKGIPGAIFIGYLLSVVGVFISSFMWLVRFGGIQPTGKNVFRSRGYMVALLVLSILFFGASVLIAALGLALGGMLNMI
jgi:hypothetical protein